jgi:hypothetical protein
MTTPGIWRARFGATLTVAAAAFLLLVGLDLGGYVFSVSEMTLDDSSTKAAIFSALLTVAGLFLTVVLAMLGIVTSMDDDKPVVRLMKHEMRNYDELVHRLVGPVFSLLVLAFAAVICLMVPSIALDKLDADQVKAAHEARRWLTIIPCFAFSVGLGLFAQTAITARLLAQVLLFKPRAHSPNDTHERAKARTAARRQANLADRTDRTSTDASAALATS